MVKYVARYFCDICGQEIPNYDEKMHKITNHLDVCRHCQINAISTAYAEDIKNILASKFESDSTSTSQTSVNVQKLNTETTPLEGRTVDIQLYAASDSPKFGGIMREHY